MSNPRLFGLLLYLRTPAKTPGSPTTLCKSLRYHKQEAKIVALTPPLVPRTPHAQEMVFRDPIYSGESYIGGSRAQVSIQVVLQPFYANTSRTNLIVWSSSAGMIKEKNAPQPISR